MKEHEYLNKSFFDTIEKTAYKIIEVNNPFIIISKYNLPSLTTFKEGNSLMNINEFKGGISDKEYILAKPEHLVILWNLNKNN